MPIVTLLLSLSHAAPPVTRGCEPSPVVSRIRPLGVHWRIGDWISNRLPGPKTEVHAGIPDAAAHVLETWVGQRFAVRVVYGRASRASGERRPSHVKKTLAVFDGVFLGVVRTPARRGLQFRIDKNGPVRIKGLQSRCSSEGRITVEANPLADEALSLEENGELLFVTVWPRQLAEPPDDRWIGLGMTLSPSASVARPLPEARLPER